MSRQSLEVNHNIHECWITKDTTLGIRLFRAPIVNDGSGDHRRLPYQIVWEDLSVGDLVVALRIEDFGNKAAAIDILQIWHVVESRLDEFRIRINNFVGMANDGKYVYDQIASLVGLPKCS